MAGSRGSAPAIKSVSSAASCMSRVMGPIESRVPDNGNAPCRLINPHVVLRPVMPFNEEGIRTEPPVSEPSAAGARPAATATPDPLDEPPGVRCVFKSQGFQGVPISGLVPNPPKANSTICTLPNITMPPRNSLSSAVDVVVLRRLVQSLDPAVVIWPSISQRSFAAMGKPSTALKLYPEARR